MARAKASQDPDYTLNIFRGTDPRSREEGWIFLVRTVKEFVSFAYEILLSVSVAEHEITLQISGIHAPLLAMPGVGPAKGLVLLKDIRGSYTLTVRKLNKGINTFKIAVGPEGIKIREKPPQAFIALATDPLPLG